MGSEAVRFLAATEESRTSVNELWHRGVRFFGRVVDFQRTFTFSAASDRPLSHVIFLNFFRENVANMHFTKVV